MSQPTRNDGWKQPSQSNPSKPTAHPTPRTSRKPWQPGAPKLKSSGRTTSRAARFIAAGVGVGLLTAVVVILILWLQPSRYPAVVVIAPDVPDSLALPENAAGVNSAAAVEEWANGDSRAKLAAGRDATAERDAWKTQLDSNAHSVVLYFAAHAGADPTGPYLWLPPKSGAVSDADKLYVSAILQRLAELPPSQPKLLVIDLAQTPANWVFGGAFNDFVRALKGMDTAIENVPGLAVLVSADEDQASWVADERRQSAFGFYFTEGLRGAAGSPGSSLTAADLHKYLSTEVQNWAVANRDANQQPVLLPKASGGSRAQSLTLATLPPGNYTTPAVTTTAPVTPKPLLDEWKRAESLAVRSPSPDTTDPLRWREYLEWLLRWERLVRHEAVPDTLPNRVKLLGDDLERRAAEDVACATVALPAGAALASGTAELIKGVSFELLWKPPADSNPTREWGKLKAGADLRRESALRVAAARFVIDRVLTLGVTADALATAEGVLDALAADGVLPVESHFLRMLYRHLPAAPNRPSADLLRTAIELRRTAEEAAWADGRAYPEQAVRWTKDLVQAADDQRQLGEDELFDTHPDSWVSAAKRFQEVADKYAAARARADAVVQALARRDTVFARLPYYARWVAAPRGGPDNAEQLVGKLEQAAIAAHEIHRLCANPPAGDLASPLAELKRWTGEAAAFDDVVAVYDATAKRLTGQVQGSNWHALDAAQTVPFRQPDPSRDLSQLARSAAAELAAKTQQPSGVAAVQFDPWPAASRHLRVAAAYMNSAPLAQGMGATDKPASNWWPQPVKLSEELATALRGLPAKAATVLRQADARATFKEAAPDYADAARFARLSDPAAPAGGSPAPPEADRRFWRHYFLLAQARRITRDGWCSADPGESNVDRWYCSRAAKLTLDTADAELGRLVPDRAKLDQEGQKRLTEDQQVEGERRPTLLDVTATATRVVVPDERQLPYSYVLKVVSGDRVGFPAAEYRMPEVLQKANPDSTARTLERGLADRSVSQVTTRTTFNLAPNRTDGQTLPLTPTVRYRGRLYDDRGTAITFAGQPNLQLEYIPPTGPAVMAVQADPEAVAGAVTILIDLSGSMTLEAQATKRSRIKEAIEGMEKLLAATPRGTQLTVGTFYGKGKVMEVNVVVSGREIAIDDDRKKVQDRVEKLLPVDRATTPLAGAVREVLDPRTNKGFWPEQFTGSRTLIVLTDGADTWTDPGNPGYTVAGKAATPSDAILAGLRAAAGDRNADGVTVYMALFAMDKDEEKVAVRQFESVENAHKDDPDLTGVRFELKRDVKDGTTFARVLAEAVMPRIRYAHERTAGTIIATAEDSLTYRATPALDPATYVLSGARNLPKVQLEPGERAVLRIEKKDDKPVLTRPLIANELAPAKGYPTEAGDTLAASLPELKMTSDKGKWALAAVVTLESRTATDKQAVKAAYPTLVWFDVERPGAADGVEPKVRIRNYLRATPGGRSELVAPAWEVTAADWQAVDNNKPGRYSTPTVKAYWQDGKPAAAGTSTRTPADLRQATDAAPLLTFDLPGVTVLDAAVDQRPDGLYLTVWLDYGKPGEPVMLRATGWKAGQGGERTGVGFKHTYYDRHARYTAEFGPFTADELPRPISFDLYKVDDLRKRAERERRAVTLPGREDGTGRKYTLPDELKLTPSQQR